MDVASARLSGSCDEYLLTVASPCAMQSLPVEILRRVVGLSVDALELQTRYARLEALATVSHKWRNVIMDDGMLWNDVRVSTEMTHGQISALLRRSRRCNLSLGIEGDLDSSSITCAEIALGHYQRIRRLDITIDNDTWPPQITRRLTDASIWPVLRHLALSHFTQDPDQNAFQNLRVNAPHLCSLELYKVDMPNLSTLDEAFPNLQNLSVQCITSAASLLPVLPNFSALRHLQLYYVPNEILSTDLLPSFSLPHLHSLEIQAMELRADLLSAIVSSNSPKLTSLSVRFHDIDSRQSRIELSAPELTNLCIVYEDAASADLALPIRFHPVPRALVSLTLTGVTDDIAAMISPSLRRLKLSYTDVDVERLSSSLSQCQGMVRLAFTCLRSTSAIAHPPTATAVLPKLTYALISQIPNEPLDVEIRRLFLDLIPPTVTELHVSASLCPSGDDLRSVLEDILVTSTELRLETVFRTSFRLTDLKGIYGTPTRRTFDVAVDSADSEYLAILLLLPAFYAHIGRLGVKPAQAILILEQCAGRLPLLEELHIFFPPDFNQNTLQTLVQRVPSPISCPRFKTLGISVDDSRRCVERVTLPIAIKRALVGLFRSQEDDVCVWTHPSVEWVE